MNTEFEELFRAELEQVEVAPRPNLVRDVQQNYQRRQKVRRRVGLTATGCVAAVAAAVIVIALQPGTPQTSKSPLADAPAVPTTVPTSSAPVTATFTATTDVTAAYVFKQAAQSVETSQGESVPLVNGWPEATYWHTETQGIDSACPGQVETNNLWLAKAGYGIGDVAMTGPKSSDPASACGGGANLGVYPIWNEPDGVQIGGQIYTWPQFAALPTDPAKLWPIVEHDATVGVAPGKGGLTFTFNLIGGTLATDPVSPALQKAFYEVLEKFPGVTVSGTYTDSLGRTGTAVTLGSSTFVIDSSTGQILAELNGAPPVPAGCVHSSLGGDSHATCQVSGASIQVFISAGPANTAPTPKGYSTAPVVLPSVIGDTAQQASQALFKAGIHDVAFKPATNSSPPVQMGDVVVAQSPAAGTAVAPETTVSITVKP